MAWTPDGRRCLTGSHRGEFTLWNGLSFKFEGILQVSTSPLFVACGLKRDKELPSASLFAVGIISCCRELQSAIVNFVASWRTFRWLWVRAHWTRDRFWSNLASCNSRIRRTSLGASTLVQNLLFWLFVHRRDRPAYYITHYYIILRDGLHPVILC